MPLRVKCPSGHLLVVPDSRCGTVVVCPRCSMTINVPAAKGKSPAERASSEAAALEATRKLQAAAVSPPISASTPALATSVSPPPPAISPPILKLSESKPEIASKPKSKPKVLTTNPQVVLETLTTKPAPKLKIFQGEAEQPTTKPPTVKPPSGAADVLASPVLESPAPSLRASVSEPESDPPAPSPIPEVVVAESAPVARPPIPSEVAAPPPKPKPEPALIQPPPLAAPTSAGTPTPPPLPAVREGIIHEPARLLVAWQVAAAMALVAVFSMCPALIDILDHFRSEDSPGVGRWAWAVILLGSVQLAYALYVSQLPDWTTLWVASLQSLAAAAGYAAVLGFVVTSRRDHWLLSFLQLSDQLGGGRAALWCIAMIAAMSLLAYFAGFVSVRWHRAENMLRALAAIHQ